MGRNWSRWLIALGVVLCSPLVVSEAQGATGQLSAPACVSGETATSPRCTQVSDAVAGGANSGLDELQSVDVSGDGESIYVTSQQDDAIVHLERDPIFGTVTFADCVTGELASGPSGTTACSGVASSTVNGAGSGFNEPSDAVISGNGEWLYATAQGDDAVLRFQRNTGTGALSYFDCITGSTSVTACSSIPTATPGGDSSGLDAPNGIAISPNGTSVYVTAANDDSVAWFSRVPATGVISFQNCVSSEAATAAAACIDAPDLTATGDGTGLDQPFSPVVSDDGDNVYFTSNGDAAVAWLDRAVNGSLTFNDCITGDLDAAPSSPPTSCGTALASATAITEGQNSGMERTQTLAISPDDESVYTGSQTDAAVVHFNRDTSDGDLTFDECLSADAGIGAGCADVPAATATGSNSGMAFVQSLAVSPDGKNLYAAGAGDAAVTSFERDLGDGDIAWSGCVTGEATAVSTFCTAQNATVDGLGSGTGGLRSLAVTPDGLDLVGASQEDAAVTTLRRDNAPTTGIDSGPDSLSTDKTPTSPSLRMSRT